MKTYVIHLETVQNLKDYLNMLGNFSFSGIVMTGSICVQPEDILLLFDSCPGGTFVLAVQNSDARELEHLGKYLEDYGLICSGEKIA